MKKYSFFVFIIAFSIFLTSTAAAAIPGPAPASTPRNIFKFEKDEVPELYLTNQSAPIYLQIPAGHEAHSEIAKALAETKAIKLSKYDKNSGVDTGFFIRNKAGRQTVNLRPGNIIEIDGVPYGTTTVQYNRLVGLGNDDYKGFIPIAQWCAFMAYQKITKVEYSAAPGSKLIEIPAENVRIAARELHALTVKTGKAIFPHSVDLENWKNRTKIVYTFGEDGQYSVYANGSFLFIESDGMYYSCRYTGDFSAFIARAKQLAAGPVNPAAPVAKTAKAS